MKELKEIPSINNLLDNIKLIPEFSIYKRDFLKIWLNEILEEIRAKIKNGYFKNYNRKKFKEYIFSQLSRKIEEIENYGIKRIINGTGVIIHTNLGRSPLNQKLLEKISQTLYSYSNLEFDLKRGKRGHRDNNLSEIIKKLMEVEDALVVNNNAAAVFLILNTFAKGKEVLVSRSELVEIGGSFRIPEIMKESGAILKEVGTTNKTKIEDYEENISEKTAMILKVHRSNFYISGFTHFPETEELIKVARKHNLIFYEDAGSGLLFKDYLHNNTEEPIISEEIKKGVDIISFSGDKLMGGPQAGIILGKENLLKKLKKNQLMRILRVDKITYFLLSEVLKEYFKDDYPLLFKIISQDYGSLEKRCRKIVKTIKKQFPSLPISIEKSYSMIGGGSTPGELIESPNIVLSVDEPEKIAKKLRENNPPIIVRIEKKSIKIDLRTVFPIEEKELVIGLKNTLE